MRTRRVIGFMCLLVLVAGCGQRRTDKLTFEYLKDIHLGMSLAEVEAIIGKGTRYSDLNTTKVELGFSVQDATEQRNTYVWIGIDGQSGYVARFKDGKLGSSNTWSLKKKQ